MAEATRATEVGGLTQDIRTKLNTARSRAEVLRDTSETTGAITENCLLEDLDSAHDLLDLLEDRLVITRTGSNKGGD